MSPQLQQVLTKIDSPEERLLLGQRLRQRQRLSSTERIQVMKYINTRQRSSVLETITNLRSQQTSFKTPEEIDAEILDLE